MRVGGKPVSSRSYSYLNEAASSFMGALGVLEPDDGKLSSPVLRGLSGRKAARLPGNFPNSTHTLKLTALSWSLGGFDTLPAA